jgi:hypothetical protein
MAAKLIPIAKNFFATTDGIILDAKGNIRNTYRNLDGYKTVSVYVDDLGWRTFGVHRLVAMAHLQCPGAFTEYTVNHLDENKDNNAADNLEWVSSSENNIHSALLKATGKRSVLVASNPHTEVLFKTTQEAKNYFNVDTKAIWDAVKCNHDINGFSIRYLRANDPLPASVKKIKSNVYWLDKRPLRWKQISTGKMGMFDSLTEAAKYFVTTNAHIHHCISKHDAVRILKGDYLLVDVDTDFPIINTSILNKANNTRGKSIIAFNLSSKTFEVWATASEFIKMRNLSKKAVTVSLRNNRLRNIGGFIFTYMSKENVLRLNNYIAM